MITQFCISKEVHAEAGQAPVGSLIAAAIEIDFQRNLLGTPIAAPFPALCFYNTHVIHLIVAR